MTDIEAKKFVEEMDKVGDLWTVKDVLDMYGDSSYETAFKDRNDHLKEFFSKYVLS